MANVKISELPAAGALAGTETVPAVQSSATTSIALSVLRDWIESEIIPQSNLNATGAPTVNDDSSAGYEPRSLWFDTSASPPEAYRCIDATAGAAVWVKTTLTLDELGSAAVEDVTAFATAAQGVTANDTEMLLWQGV